MCDSERFSPLAEVVHHSSSPEMRLVFRRPGLLQSRPTFDAAYARACLDCGAIVWFLARNDLERLAEVPEELGSQNNRRRWFDEAADTWIEEN